MSWYIVFGVLVVVLGIINLLRMGIFLVGSDIYSLKQHIRNKRRQGKSTLPTISVVIPAHNEEDTILRCVSSVVQADYPKRLLQIVVVNDGSTDHTAQVVKTYQEKQSAHGIELINLKKGGKARSLNTAIKHRVTGDLVMCLDSDSAIEKDALRAVARHFENKRLMALSANVKIIDDGSLLSLIQLFEYIICYQMKRAQTIFNVEYIIGGIGSTFRRSMLERVNYYDTNTITEDIDLTMKIISEGNKENRVAYGSDVVVYTESVKSIGGLIKQRYRWKYGRAQTFWKNRSLFFNTDRKYSRWLTLAYLPFALFSDLAFLLEPIALGFILYVTFRYTDPITILSALTVISLYIGLNVVAENTIPVKKKLALLPLVPTMYLFFWMLSFVEYVALIKSIPRMHKIPESIRSGVCHWDHVARTRTTG